MLGVIIEIKFSSCILNIKYNTVHYIYGTGYYSTSITQQAEGTDISAPQIPSRSRLNTLTKELPDITRYPIVVTFLDCNNEYIIQRIRHGLTNILNSEYTFVTSSNINCSIHFITHSFQYGY